MKHVKPRYPDDFIFLAVLLSFIFCSVSGPANDNEGLKNAPFFDEGLVVVVYDGDTVKIRFDDGREHKARLIGIDAPEIEDERDEVKFLAHLSKRFTFFHLYRKRVKLEYDWERLDQYGRLLVYVWTEDAGLFNELILKEGFASVLTKFPYNQGYRKRFIAAERHARALEKGFWQKEPFVSIPAEEAHDHVGTLLSVKYYCSEVRIRGNFIFLDSSRDFSALIPRAQASQFPRLDSLKGHMLSVKGFLETYKGKPQIMVVLPLQINIE